MKRTPLWAWCALAGVVIFAGAVRLPLLDVPLERDEGEYAYVGQLILQGVPPYTLAYNMKLPGIYAVYAVLIGVLGPTHGAIHFGLLVINAITTVLLFLLGRRLLGDAGAVAAAASFALLSMGETVQGLFANAEHFVLLFAVGGLLLLSRPAPGTRRLLAAGALLGLGLLTKQHGAAFVVCGVLWTLAAGGDGESRKVRMQRGAWLVAGVAAPYLLTCLVLAAAGAFGRFWFWTVEYAAAYTAQVPLGQAWMQLASNGRPIVSASPLLWILVAAGPVALWIDSGTRPRALRVLVLAALSLLATAPGFFFRPHYFVLTLPAAGLLCGATVQAIIGQVERRRSLALGTAIGLGLAAAAMGDALARQGDYLFRMTPREVVRATYGANPFPESLEIARYIRENSSEEDLVAILGSEPQILFYSGRRSASPYIYTYALMELHDHAPRMQEEMIASIEAARPRFLVFVRVQTSWLQRPGSPPALFQWFERYQQEYYDVVGLAEMVSDEETIYRWGDDVVWPPRTVQWVAVMKRRGE